MKRWLTLLTALIALVIFAPPGFAGGDEPPQYWICGQIGVLDKKLTYAVSPVFLGEANHYERKEIEFEKAVVEQTNNQFLPEFEARCFDFTSREKAQKELKEKLQQAEKRNFQILWIKFATSRQNH